MKKIFSHKKTIKKIMVFFIAFISFYSFQNVLFSQTNITKNNKKTVIETKDTKKKNISTSVIKEEQSLDTKLDSIVKSIHTYLGTTFLKKIASPLVIVIVLIPLLSLITYLIGLLLRLFVFYPILALWKKRVKKENDNAKNIVLIDKIKNLINPFFIALGFRLSIVPLEAYFNTKITILRSPANAILIIVITLIVQKIVVAMLNIIGSSIAQKTETNIDDQLLPLGIGVVKVSIIGFGFFIALSAIGVNTAPLVASLGAMTFALGFAVKDSLSNFIAGIFLVLEDAFNVGDKIDIEGVGVGNIYEIGLRTTKMKTFDNEIVVIPNNVLMNKQYKNFRLPDDRIRVVAPFTVSYGNDIQRVKDIILEATKNIDNILDDPAPAVDFLNMDDFALSFRLKFLVPSYEDQMAKKLEAIELIYNALNKEKIDIPFPTQTVILEKE